MRAILIDPYARSVTEVLTDGDLASMYRVLSTKEHKVECLCHVTLVSRPNAQLCWLDDEGFLSADRAVFYFEGSDQPLCGRGLILGADEEGGNRSTFIPVEFVKAHVVWTDKVSSGDFTPLTERMEGDTFVIDAGKPILKDPEPKP